MMSKFTVTGYVQKEFQYEIEAGSADEVDKIAYECAKKEFGYFDSFTIDEVYEDGE